MGGCLSSLSGESTEDLVLHRGVEKQLREVCAVNSHSFSHDLNS